MTLTTKDISIIAQATAHDTAQIVAAEIKAGILDVPAEVRFADVYHTIFEVVSEKCVSGVEAIKAAFPGSVAEPVAPPAPSAPTNVVQFPQQQAPAPAPVPGSAGNDKEALWREYFNDPSAWYDNRNDPKKGNGPDFRFKQDRNKALWVKYAPAWAKQALTTSGHF